MRSLFVEGNGPFHRLPAGPKLAALAAIAVALFLTRDPLVLGLALVLAALAFASLRQGVRHAFSTLKFVLLTVAMVGLFNLVFVSAEEAVVTVARLSTLALSAATVTATTRIGEVMAVVTRAARPLERVGLGRADDIGLAVGLVIRFLPDILDRYEAIKLAQQARGIEPRPFRLIGPLIILTLWQADRIANAIDARGIRRQ
jgi:biotin transport system permease protein